MKIVLLPLDERPCNLKYPSLMPLSKDINIVVPNKNILSNKKIRCDLNVLHEWLLEECKDADYAIISMDTLLYGGIVPSRLHHDSLETLLKRSSLIEKIKKQNPKLKVYVNELIMRTPSYSLSDEEPDYFDECGRELWQYGVYLDKKEQGVISLEEEKAFKELDENINHEYLSDLINRREINKKLILNSIEMYKDGIIDYLVIPQDDCHPYGFTSRDRKQIVKFIDSIKLNKELLMYPGADESGMTLLSKILNDYYKTSLKVFVVYQSEVGRRAIPNFEDREVEKTISFHLKACGLTEVENKEDADIVLFVNNGHYFPEGNKNDAKEFDRSRELSAFLQDLKQTISSGKVAGIADIVYCNRGDEKLFNNLFKEEMFGLIHAYAGWNTSSNTLDTTLCCLVSYYFSRDDQKKNYFLLHRYIEDFFYMDYIRTEVIEKIAANPQWNIKINALNKMKMPLQEYTKERLMRLINKFQLNSLYWINKLEIDFVWNRTFEIELIIE